MSVTYAQEHLEKGGASLISSVEHILFTDSLTGGFPLGTLVDTDLMVTSGLELRKIQLKTIRDFLVELRTLADPERVTQPVQFLSVKLHSLPNFKTAFPINLFWGFSFAHPIVIC